MSAGDDWRETFRPDIPSPARMYNYFLGGKDHFEADRKAAVLLVAVVPFIDDRDHPADLIGQLVRPLAPGSYVALSHATSDSQPQEARAVERIYRATTINIHARTRSQVLAMLGDGIEPGSVPAGDPADSNVYAVVARKT